jgi:hypothetical protein
MFKRGNDMKTGKSMERIVRYLRDFSIVVAGIAVTLLGQDWLTGRNEKKDIELYLNAVKLELQDNLELVNKTKYYYERSLQYSTYLSSNTMRNLHPDTLRHYFDLNKYIPIFIYKTSAFDMLKNSGVMRLIKDKRKVQLIWNCYARLEETKIGNDFYIQRKISEIDRNNDSVVDAKPESLYLFFKSILSNDMKNVFHNCSENITHTLSQL